MAGNPANVKEELEMSLDEDSVPGNHSQSQEHMAITEMIERGPWSPGVSQRRQKLESKVTTSAGTQPAWTMTTPRAKKTRKASGPFQVTVVAGDRDPVTVPSSPQSETARAPERQRGHHSQLPRMQRDQGHGETHAQENTGNAPNMRYKYDRNPGADLVAEIGLEELNGLEMEIMRRQMQVITARLRVLEDQDATWRYKETLLFTLLLSACIVNLWLWMRQ
ncbi:fetal and adult testis-expressed transcript protein [Dipodomys spectabilis]|uniref:fetal and adult testis-expressed transcript protein n=1 Tax=Dipodomys spectabilis TaxID=105255 RepID=UPI001C535F42|nr:fetal and adult testis-expressed transcript protein [Dipodomys spectabilis]